MKKIIKQDIMIQIQINIILKIKFSILIQNRAFKRNLYYLKEMIKNLI